MQWWMYPMKPMAISEKTAKWLKPNEYLLELKLDGWRCIVIIQDKPTFWTRQKRKIDVPESMVDTISALKLPEGTVLDGEIWNPEKRGGWKSPEGDGALLSIWDCIRIGNRNISDEPLSTRNEIAREIIPNEGLVSFIQQYDLSIENIEAIKKKAYEIRRTLNTRSGFIHGVVIKRTDSIRRDHPSRSSASADWMKIVFKGIKGWEPTGHRMNSKVAS